MKKAIELQRQIAAKEAKQADLLVELDRSLHIGQLWPNVWEQAKKLNARVVSNWTLQGKNATFSIRLRSNENGATLEQRQFAHADVPEVLHNSRVECDLSERRKGRYNVGRV